MWNNADMTGFSQGRYFPCSRDSTDQTHIGSHVLWAATLEQFAELTQRLSRAEIDE